MKAKILLVSTRWINKDDSIFSNAKRCDPNASLKDYFCHVSNDDLRKVLAKKHKSQNQGEQKTLSQTLPPPVISHEQAKEIRSILTDRLKNDSVISKYYVGRDYLSFVKQIYVVISNLSEDIDYKDQEIEFQIILDKIKPYLPYIDAKPINSNKELPPFIYSQEKDDFADCLESNAINIDLSASVSLTIADRLSLYKITGGEFEDMESNERTVFLVYAVWPLGNSDKDNSSNNKKDNIKWIDQLTKAVKEECKENESIDLVLLLHDNDMSSTAKTPLKTLVIDDIVPDEIAEGVKRTVAVFQHSNIKFISMARQEKDKNAKIIYESARKFIVDELIFQQLAKLSRLIATYSKAEDNKNIKEMIDWLKCHVKEDHDPKGYISGLDNLYSACKDGSTLTSSNIIDYNRYVNNLIKEIVLPEKFKC